MSKASVKLEKNLWERVKRASEAEGYSSPEEFVEHVLEKELAKTEQTDSDEEIANKLKGLGYLD